MSNEPDESEDKARWAKFKAALSAEPDPSALVPSLLLALQGKIDSNLSHEKCLALLPQFVDAEIAGQSLREYYSVKHHLDTCESCEKAYVDLFTQTAEQERTLVDPPTPNALPPLGTLFQPLTNSEQQRLIVDISRLLVQQVSPEETRLMRPIAQSFFKDPTYALRQAALSEAALSFGLQSRGRVLTPFILALVQSEIVPYIGDRFQKATDARGRVLADLVRSAFQQGSPSEGRRLSMYERATLRLRTESYATALGMEPPNISLILGALSEILRA